MIVFLLCQEHCTPISNGEDESKLITPHASLMAGIPLTAFPGLVYPGDIDAIDKQFGLGTARGSLIPMNKITKDVFLEIFPFFQKGSPEAVSDILWSARHDALPPNTMMQLEGKPCDSLGLMLSGVKRIYKTSGSGREITLYEVGPGETCILNASCILSNIVCPVNAVSVTDISMLSLSAKDFRGLIGKYEEIRSFIFVAISQNFASIIQLIQEVAFRKMDERLFDYLVEKSEEGKLITTHQKIADDLGTAREVVSRLLKDFERKGTVRLSRNHIELARL